MNDKRKREVVVAAFIATGKDYEEGLIEYIDILERAVIKLDKAVNFRKRSRSLKDVWDIIRQEIKVPERAYLKD